MPPALELHAHDLRLRAALAAMLVTTVTGCATPSTLLINDEGQVVRCAAQGWGYVGAPMATKIDQSYVTDYKKLGYRELPDGVVGLFLEPGTARVSKVASGSAADEVGIRAGNLVTQIDGRAIRNNADLLDVMAHRKAGDMLVISVTRRGVIPVDLL